MRKILMLTMIIPLCLMTFGSGGSGTSSAPVQVDERAWFSRGQESFALGRYDEALMCFETVLAINPSFVDAYRFMGDVYLKQGKPDNAIQSYQKALASKSQMVSALVGIGNSYYEKSMFDQALAAYDRALAIQPANASAHIGRGNVYFKKDDREGALAEYRQGIAVEPEHAGANFSMGVILEKKGDNAGAAQHFYKAGMRYIREGDRVRALKACEQLKRVKAENLEKLLAEALQTATQ